MSIVTNEYIDRVINDLKSEQKITLDTCGRVKDEDIEKNNKYISLLSSSISSLLKIKEFKKLKESSKKVPAQ